MKILIDPIYTASVDKCASSVKMKRVVESLLEYRDDLYVYWLIPDTITDEAREWLPHDSRIAYIERSYSPDRMKEYLRFYKDYEYTVAFDGVSWDWDIIFTNRTMVAPLIKLTATRVGKGAFAWAKKVFIMEGFPTFSFRKMSSWGTPQVADVQLLASYLATDCVAINSFWERDEILKIAHNTLAPSKKRQLAKTLVESVTRIFKTSTLKSKESIGRMLNNERPFTISFSGRMVQRHKFADIFHVMEKNWVFQNDKPIRLVVTTNSKANNRVHPPKTVQVHYTGREAFWDMVKNEIDVGLFMSIEEGLSMSLMEPIIMGLPMAVKRAKHSVSSLGEDYPFFFNTLDEAFCIVREFYHDYPKQYQRFAEWSKSTLDPLLEHRNQFYIGGLARGLVDQWDADLAAYHEKFVEDNKIVTMLMEHITVGETFNILDILKECANNGELPILKDKFVDEYRDKNKMAFSTDWNYFRLILMGLHGAVDAGPELGTMRIDE